MDAQRQQQEQADEVERQKREDQAAQADIHGADIDWWRLEQTTPIVIAQFRRYDRNFYEKGNSINDQFRPLLNEVPQNTVITDALLKEGTRVNSFSCNNQEAQDFSAMLTAFIDAANNSKKQDSNGVNKASSIDVDNKDAISAKLSKLAKIEIAFDSEGDGSHAIIRGIPFEHGYTEHKYPGVPMNVWPIYVEDAIAIKSLLDRALQEPAKEEPSKEAATDESVQSDVDASFTLQSLSQYLLSIGFKENNPASASQLGGFFNDLILVSVGPLPPKRPEVHITVSLANIGDDDRSRLRLESALARFYNIALKTTRNKEGLKGWLDDVIKTMPDNSSAASGVYTYNFGHFGDGDRETMSLYITPN